VALLYKRSCSTVGGLGDSKVLIGVGTLKKTKKVIIHSLNEDSRNKKKK